MPYFGVITGAPCSGKSTYVAKSKVESDLVIDLDAIHVALGSRRTHYHPRFLLKYALAARAAVLREVAAAGDASPNVWLVTCWPTSSEFLLLPKHAYELRMPTSKQDCLARAVADKRPAETAEQIERWFAQHGNEKLFS